MRPNEPVNRLMSEPVLSITADAPIADAVRLFIQQSVHHLPVLDQGRLVGMLSTADVMRRQFLEGHNSEPGDLPVRHLMSMPVQRVTEHDNVQRAIELMIHGGIHALPVVNSSDELVGIVTTTDIMLEGLASSSGSPAASDRTHPLSPQRVAAALTSARKAVNANRDPFGIAATLLCMQSRVSALQEAVSAAKRFLNAGQDEHLHSALIKAIEHTERLDEQLCQPSAIGLA